MGDNNALRLTSNIAFFILSVAIFILRILDNDPLNMVVEFESYALVASILYYIIMTFMDSLKGKLGDTFDKVKSLTSSKRKCSNTYGLLKCVQDLDIGLECVLDG